MLGGAYSSQYKTLERQHVDTIKTFAENEKSDSIARAKKLSIETNRRRRALAIKRKSEAEREEKRRQHILTKRREKQQEATEKFQRGHIQSRPGSGSSSGRWSPRRANIHTQLEDALKIVRGSPASSRASSARSRNQSSPNSSLYRQHSDPLSKPYFNKYAHPSINSANGIHTPTNTQHKQEELHSKSLRNLNSSRNLFEQQLESYQQSLLEQQQKTLNEFNKQIMKEIEVDKNVVNNEMNGVNGLERSVSLSTVDSLEDGNSNDTLRESCDLNAFMTQKKEDSFVNGAKNVTFADDHKEAIKIFGNNSHIQSAVSTEPKNIDSYNAQFQALQTSNQRSDEQKQQFYIQRQKEIQQQLQEQQKQQLLLQQKQQKELQEKVLEQQQKQQQLLQQQYERQKQEQLEKQQQHEQKYLQPQASLTTTTTNGYTNKEEGNGNQRPKAQLKAWATPSPQPPAPASSVVTTAQTYVTHTSPYTGKNTHTNTTVHVVTSNGHGSKSNTPVSVNNLTTVTQSNSPGSIPYRVAEKNMQANTDINKSEYMHTSPPVSAQDKSLSFLETVTYGLSVTPDSNSTNSTSTSVPKTQSSSSVSVAKNVQQVSKTNGSSSIPTKAVTTTAANVSKPIHAGYYNSYGAAYSARQQLTNGSTNKQAGSDTPSMVTTQATTSKTNGDVSWALPQGLEGQFKVMTGGTTMNGDDTADTDSISTICDDREPEPKEVKSILKGKGSGKKTGGILKKSGSTGNMKEIRDSLEITRVHLQTSAEEKEQRMLREKERLKNPPPTPTKKNVRFADLCYDNEPEQNDGEVNDKLFIRRNRNDNVTQKPPRPVSAVTTKTLSSKVDSKPPRASSATARTSTIPRAKTQIVRPQAAAHIITQSTQNLDNTCLNEKVTMVNSNFMEKVPAMARANQTALSVAPASVYSVTSVGYSQPQQKVNYAVSSIVMPKSESAPFIYPGYNKQGPIPAGSVNGPMHAGNNSKNVEAVYDENGVRIDRTPTDEEINFLWDKLRNCLSRNSQATPDAGQTDSLAGSSRQAAPVAHTYIDGNALGQFNSLNRVAQQPNPALRRQNSLDSANNSYTRRYGLLQQRKQQPNPNSLKSRQLQQQQQQQQQQGYTVYQPPVQSHSEPQSSGPVANGAEVTESMAGFLAAEQMADQSMSESRIQQAIDEAQARQQAYNSTRPQPKVKSALSIEEQRLMESLDRLNDELKTADVTIPNTAPQTQPPQQQHPRQQVDVHRSSFLTADGKVSGFKGHTPITQRRVIEAGNHRARLRITSAHLKRNLHRHQ